MGLSAVNTEHIREGQKAAFFRVLPLILLLYAPLDTPENHFLHAGIVVLPIH